MYYKVRVDKDGFMESIKAYPDNGEPMGFAGYNTNNVMVYRAQGSEKEAAIEAQRFAKAIIEAGEWGNEEYAANS